MIKVALRSLMGRKLRFALTAFAIVLGVAMVSGTYVLTDTIKAGFGAIYTASYKNTDAVVTEKQAFGNSGAETFGFPESLLAKVQKLPGVAQADGSVTDQATQLVGQERQGDHERRRAEPRLRRRPQLALQRGHVHVRQVPDRAERGRDRQGHRRQEGLRRSATRSGSPSTAP